MSQIRPNTFLIGAQKSATTSVYNWISQHPDVCAPTSLKDFPFFARDQFYAMGLESLRDIYVREGYSNHKIVLQGSVQYMFYEKAIDRIFEFSPEARLIMVLRNPVDRAISAYMYFKKMKLETLSLEEALECGSQRMKDENFRITSELTYVEHGLYGKQLERIYRRFPAEQVLILSYEDVQNSPEDVVADIFKFLNIREDFKPNFKILNRTGSVRFNWIQNMIFKENDFRKRLVKLVDPILPMHKRTKIRLYIKEWNTSSKQRKDDSFETERQRLRSYFKQDILLLESLTGMDFNHWK